MKKEKGITLIALVITIIVLLILAGVSIAMLTGNNGILTQAQRAKNETENAQADEENTLTSYEQIINASTGVTLETITGYETNNTVTQDSLGNRVVVPAGFRVVNPGDNVEDGIIIEDVSHGATAGSQFVWIPVTDEKQYKRNTSYVNANVSAKAYTDTGYLPDGMETEDDESNEYSERIAVTSKGGFYISRYEAGKEGENTLVSKSGATVWSNISQEDCKIEAKKFINNDNVKSALCSGIQWDMTMAFVNGKEDGSSDENKTYNVTQYKASRHIGSTEESGQNPVDRVCNIFDLEGNYREYVAEMSSYDTNNLFIHRGGSYVGTSSASDRYNYNGSRDPNISFRFVLYVM